MNIVNKHICGRVAACLLAGALCLPLPAMAQEVDVDLPTGSTVYGNSSTSDPTANYNLTPQDHTLNINAAVTGEAYGAYTTSNTEVSGNTVNLNVAGSVSSYIYGGYLLGSSNSANVTGNTVNINGGTATDAALGGRSSGTGDVTGNTVNVYAGSTLNSGGTAGQASGGLSSQNAVNIYGGTITGWHVYGGYNTTGIVSDNTVTVSDGTIGSEIRGGDSGGDALNNTVTISGGTINGDVYGGFSGNGNATGNTVDISGGTFGAVTIYGGYSASGDITGNTVTISGNPDLSAATVFVVRIPGGSTGTLSDNTLNIKTAGIAINRISNFDTLNFYLPSTVKNGDTIVTVNYAFISDTTVNVGVEGSSSPLKSGDTIVLIDSPNSLGTPGNTTANGEGMQGITQKFTFDLSVVDKQLLALVSGSSQNDQVKSLVESRIGGIGMVNQGADLMASQGIAQLRANAATSSGPAAFAVMGGGKSRYNSGSHVDVESMNASAGLGWNFALNEGRNGNLLLGAFFEAGHGSYDSHNSFSSGGVKGDGDTNYYGGGILARYDTAPIGPGNAYAEATGRAGRVKTDYESSDFASSTGGDVDFDSSSTYYGAHLGIGYIWNITQAANLDIYTKYFWTHQDSDSVTIQSDRIKFKSMDSHRWRGGARFGYDLLTDKGSKFTPYIGAAYEHEFDSEAKATTNGSSIDSPDVEGGTGIGEIGLAFKPVDSGFSIDLGVQGYTGKREGVSGSMQLKFEF